MHNSFTTIVANGHFLFEIIIVNAVKVFDLGFKIRDYSKIIGYGLNNIKC